MESNNNLIKNNGTFRKRLPVADFLNLVSERLVKRWSRERADDYPDNTEFYEKVNPTLETWTNAWHWELKNSKINIAKKKLDNSTIYYIASKTNPNKQQNKESIIEYKNNFNLIEVNDFDKWYNLTTSIWTVQISSDSRQSTCTCPFYRKNYVCKHILALSCKEKKLEWHPNAHDVPLGQKRKKGNPGKTKKALQIQPSESQQQQLQQEEQQQQQQQATPLENSFQEYYDLPNVINSENVSNPLQLDEPNNLNIDQNYQAYTQISSNGPKRRGRPREI